MTTDDLRTRAREVAAGRYPQEPDRGLAYPREAIRQGQAAAFITGALWHASQHQPTREQVARAIYDALGGDYAPYRAATDAVLALFDGAGS